MGGETDMFVHRDLWPKLYNRMRCHLYLLLARLQQVSGVLRV